MKPLNTMTRTEKGKLLAGLFPERLAGILESLRLHYHLLSQEEETLRANWDDTLLPFDCWYRIATSVAAALDRYGGKLSKSTHLFAEELFCHHNALYTIDCILKQAQGLPEQREHTAYKLCVQLLFGQPADNNRY